MNKVLFVNVDFLDKKRKVNIGQMSKWLVENNHPAIISRKASLLIVNMDNKRKENDIVKHRSQLSGYVFCGICGRMMKEKPIHSGKTYEQRIWFCFDDSHPKVKIKQNDVLSCFSKISTKSLSRLSPRRRVSFSDKIANKNEGIVEKTRKIQEDFVQVLKRDDAMPKNIMLIDKKQVHNNRLQVINQYTIGQDQGAKHRSWLRCSSG